MKVWVNGTFDVIHVGHIRLLEYASSLGIVRVGVDSDDRVKKLKGDSRPINNLYDRMELIGALKYVDSVVSFSSDGELRERIKEWNPTYFVIGSDYKNRNIIGSEFAEIRFFERIAGYSSTNTISRRN